MKNKILLLVISIILFFIGFYFYQNVQSFLLSFIPELVINYRKLLTQILQSISFGFSLSIIPVFSFILWNKFKIEKNREKFYIILSFLAASIIALTLRTKYLIFINNSPLKSVILSKTENGIEQRKPFYEGENLNFNFYIFIAEIITFLILYFVLNKNKRKNRIN